ncbi:MAG TPA: cytochrome c biogenesis protein CcsA, partial [Luteolibacter sp.]|nr:cytochrome c biogenesis protein CcsA [Luteolibacter sp.]
MSKPRYTAARWVAASLLMAVLLLAILLTMADNAPKGKTRVIEGYQPWPEEVIRIAETLPVQDGGRVKPLSSHAGFIMLRLHGARSMRIDDGKGEVHKLSPTAWMLDTLLRPQFAIKQPSFRVDNSEALLAVGLESRGRRDRYTYEELEPGRKKLLELAATYEPMEARTRDPLQSQVVDLASNLRTYESFFAYLSFARTGVMLRGFGGSQKDTSANISAMMATAPQLREHLQQLQSKGEEMHPQLRELLDQLLMAANFSKYGLFILPPENGDAWNSAGEAIMTALQGGFEDPSAAISNIAHLETVARSVSDLDQVAPALTEFKSSVHGQVKNDRLEWRLGLEAFYYRSDLFYQALVIFVLGSIASLIMWLGGWSLPGRVAYWATWAMSSIGLILCVVAIAIRCIIMERPPVGNLYDTIIFIAATKLLIVLLVELFTKTRIALGIGPILGAALIFLARRYELGDAVDHMDPLIAVLDSNFWLSTHVVTITIGYAAGLLAAKFSAVYLLMRMFGLDEGNPAIRRVITRAVYAIICLTLFLSLVGTVLGGIWANDSWGRFWGWDPKENGALLIVLWTLAILHARMGGYIREWGIHLASV